MKMNNSAGAIDERIIDVKHIGVLDGIRAISILFVLSYHFWQQNWIWPSFDTPFLSWCGIDRISFNELVKCGYLFVDALVLLSGFLLFLPVARHVLLGEEFLNWKSFYRRRAARILPSYLLNILVVFFLFALPYNDYRSNSAWAIKDIITHLTFTHTLWSSTYMNTNLNPALWTVAVEVWFYLLFPLFARIIKRNQNSISPSAGSLFRTAVLYIAMNAAALAYIYLFALKKDSALAMRINQLPAFLGVYANGMLGAFIFVFVAKKFKRSRSLGIAGTIIALLSAAAIVFLVRDCAQSARTQAQIWQVVNRFKLSVAFLVFILSSAISSNAFRWLFSNKLMRFLSTISFNLYIWHSWIALQLKYRWRIPAWTGDIPPCQLGDMAWSWKYTAIALIAAFAIATVITYCFEKPAAKLILTPKTTDKPGISA